MDQKYPITRLPLPPGVKLIENVYITMRDGVKLAVDAYLPDKPGKYPVLLGSSPYRKEAQLGSPVKGYHSEVCDPGIYIPRGYIVCVASTRGTGMSQGQYNYYDIEEQKDGYDLVEGLAKQSWCDGNIGMIGGSYYGKSQYYTAAQRPPHLKCIVPFGASIDIYRDLVYHTGGCYFGPGFMDRWASEVTSDCLWPGPVEGKLPPMDMSLEYHKNFLDGPWYWERSLYPTLDRIQCPVLHIASASSWLNCRGQLLGYSMIKSTQKLVIGPPNYNASYSRLFWGDRYINEYVLRWYDHWLKGIDTGIMKEPPVLIYDRGADEWRYENEYPLARMKMTKYYLHSNPAKPDFPQGLISAELPGKNEAPDTFVSPRDRGAGDKPPLAYVSAPLEKNLKLHGPISATIYGSTMTENTAPIAWFVKVGEVQPDGKVSLITKGCIKASYRKVDESKSKPGQPWHPFDEQVYIESGKIYDFQIEIQPLFHTFKAGYRIWLQIACDDPEFRLNNIQDRVMGPVPASNTIYHDQLHQSHLLLPVIPEAPIIAPVTQPMWSKDNMERIGLSRSAMM